MKGKTLELFPFLGITSMLVAPSRTIASPNLGIITSGGMLLLSSFGMKKKKEKPNVPKQCNDWWAADS